MSDKEEVTETVVQHVTCGRCAARYDYDHTATGEAALGYTLTGKDIDPIEARQKAVARLAATFDRGLVVPCPRCKALTPAMQKQRLRMALKDLGVVVIALLVAWGVMLAALESGALAWGIGILALLTALGFTFKLLGGLFGGYLEKIGRLVETP